MINLRFPFAAMFLIALLGYRPVLALDVVSGASQGRSMVSVSAITTTNNSASLTYSEVFRNGSLRFYYSATAFAAAADTTRATVTKQSVATRGSGTLNVTGLAADTKYYFRLQGWYGRGEANYWATGSFTTAASAGIVGTRKFSTVDPSPAAKDPLGRNAGSSSGATFRTTGSALSVRH